MAHGKKRSVVVVVVDVNAPYNTTSTPLLFNALQYYKHAAII